MILNNTQPITIPATEAKEFPQLWLTSVQIAAPSTTEGFAVISAAPYNSETKEMALELTKRISIHNLWKAVSEVPEAEAAMNALLAAVEPLEAWEKSQEY